jgi:hypothetical protein
MAANPIQPSDSEVVVGVGLTFLGIAFLLLLMFLLLRWASRVRRADG